MNDDTNAVKAVDEARRLNAEVRGYIRTAKGLGWGLAAAASGALLVIGVMTLGITHGQAGDLLVVIGAVGSWKTLNA